MLNMSFEEAKKRKEELDARVDMLSKRYNEFERGRMGLTPDHVRATPEWKKVDQEFKIAFKELQDFNKIYVKRFKGRR